MKAAIQQAIDAMKRIQSYGDIMLCRRHEQKPYEQVCEAITVLETLLAEIESAEPVAWLVVESTDINGLWETHTPQLIRTETGNHSTSTRSQQYLTARPAPISGRFTDYLKIYTAITASGA
jgi:hypothetical protein